MQTVPPLKISVVANSERQLTMLKDVILETSGFSIVQLLDINHADRWGQIDINVDAWIMDLALDSEYPPIVDQLLDEVAFAPIIFNDGEAPPKSSEQYREWRRRLLNKMAELAGTVSLQDGDVNEEQVDSVWVLAASLGGPQAVKEFLDALPPNLDVAFIYVQHNQQDFDRVLADVLARHSHYTSYVSHHGDVLKKNRVALFPVDRETQVMPNGTVIVTDQPWPGKFTPSINYVIANVAKVYGKKCGVIVFSGMGDDGKTSCRIMKQQGGQVWIQEPSTCVCDSMPVSARDTKCVSYVGTPIQLAKHLSYWLMAAKKL